MTSENDKKTKANRLRRSVPVVDRTDLKTNGYGLTEAESELVASIPSASRREIVRAAIARRSPEPIPLEMFTGPKGFPPGSKRDKALRQAIVDATTGKVDPDQPTSGPLAICSDTCQIEIASIFVSSMQGDMVSLRAFRKDGFWHYLMVDTAGDGYRPSISCSQAPLTDLEVFEIFENADPGYSGTNCMTMPIAMGIENGIEGRELDGLVCGSSDFYPLFEEMVSSHIDVFIANFQPE